MEPVTARLKKLRESANPKLSIRAMADELGLPHSTYAAYEDGKKFKKPLLPLALAKRIADVLEPRHVDRSEVLQIAGLTGDLQPASDAKVLWIPVIGLASASSWREAISHPSYEIPIRPRKMSHNAFAVEVSGDSMNRLLPEGGWAVVDPDQTHLYDMKVYLVANEEHETTIKRYRSNPARFEPVSDNPAHETIFMTGQPITVLGRIICYGNDEGL